MPASHSEEWPLARSIFRLVLLTAVPWMFAANAAHAAILGIQNNASVYTINEATGAATLLQNNPAFAANAMTRTSTGVYYVAGGLGNGGLNTVNPVTGQVTAGPNITPNDDVRGLAASPADVIYATIASGGITANLHTINVTTGATTLIGPVGVMQALTFSSAGTLYGWSNVVGLVTIDPATAAVTDVNPAVGSDDNIQTLAFSSGGVLYAGGQTNLYTVNVTTGVLTLVGSLAPVTDLRGMEFLSAAPPAPGVSLTPSPLAFGNQVISTTSAAQVLTLQNIGTAALNITSIAASADFAQTNACPGSLAPAATCTVNVTFTPTALGLRNGTITVVSNAASSPNTVPLSGTGVAAPTGPAASLSPPTLTFAGQVVATTSVAQALTLTNIGDSTLTIASIAASGDFSQTNGCAATLAAGASCTINVTFTPTLIGPRSGAITVTSNGTGSPNTAGLNGTGIAAPGPPPPSAVIPTLSEWGLVLLVMLVAMLGLRERRFASRRD
jgi:hypothetical protein